MSAKKAKLHKKVAKPKDAALARAVHARRAARREVEGRREPPEAEASCRAAPAPLTCARGLAG